MRIHIADRNTLPETELKKLTDGSVKASKVYCDRRNRVEKIITDSGENIVVKRFKVPCMLNRIVYGVFRKSKARRAFEWSQRLNEAGFATPEPLAYAEERKGGLFTRSWFISRFVDAPTLLELNPLEMSADERHVLFEALAKYIHRLHEAGFVPGDMNAGNIFCLRPRVKGQEGYDFVLTDVNRTKRLKGGRMPDMRMSMRSFGQMFSNPSLLSQITPIYASLRGFEPDEALFEALGARIRRRRRRRFIHRFTHPFSNHDNI